MNRLITTLTLLLPALLHQPPVTAAHDFVVDGIYYNHISDAGMVEVTQSPDSINYSGAVTIPGSVTSTGLTVRAVRAQQ